MGAASALIHSLCWPGSIMARAFVLLWTAALRFRQIGNYRDKFLTMMVPAYDALLTSLYTSDVVIRHNGAMKVSLV